MWLLLAMYREETSSLESNEMIKQYKGVTALHSEWEDGWFNLAQYYDKVMMKTGKEGENQPEQRRCCHTHRFQSGREVHRVLVFGQQSVLLVSALSFRTLSLVSAGRSSMETSTSISQCLAC